MLQAKLNVEKGLQTEVEHLCEASKQFEIRPENKNVEDEDKRTKREKIRKAKLFEADIALQAVKVREMILMERPLEFWSTFKQLYFSPGVNLLEKCITESSTS